MLNLVSSGIENTGKIPWGTHMCQLYSSREELNKVAMPYIKAGLEDNELCIWIYSHHESKVEVIEDLEIHCADLREHIANNRLLIIPSDKWYTKENQFVGEKVVDLWIKLIEFTKSKSFKGLRAVADVSFIKPWDYKSFELYENLVNKKINNRKFTVLCLYKLDKIYMPQLGGIINNHIYSFYLDDCEVKLIQNIKLLTESEEFNEKKMEIEKLKKSDSLKSEFFSNISHDLRTPLNIILAAIKLINQHEITENNNIKHYLKTIQQNCYRQLRLINNLIDVSRINTEFYDMDMQICNIVELVENITFSVTDFIKSHGISLVFDTNEELVSVKCDPDKIERIILNLLSNAIKFTNRGGSIRVKIYKLDNLVYILVKDTGCGIPPEKLNSIFNRFEQSGNSLIKERQGSGIGLSLVKSMIERHNGRIGVKSQVGAGSEFIIELPVEDKIIEDERGNFNKEENSYIQRQIEKINIEFSDIYA